MSDDPMRIPDDPSMSPELRSDFSRALSAPTAPYDVARGLAAFEARIALTTDGGASTAASGTATSGAATQAPALAVKTLGSWWVRIGLAVALAGASGGLYLGLQRSTQTNASASTAAPQRQHAVNPSHQPAPALPITPAVTAPVASPVATEPPQAPSENPIPTPAPATAPVVAAPAARAHRNPQPRADLVLAETRLLATQRAALVRDHDPARALQLAAQGEQEFPNGIFHEEREALAIQALAALGRRTEAAVRARTFLRRHPQGPLSDRVREATTPH